MLLEDMVNEALSNNAKESVDIKETTVGTVKSIEPIVIRADGLDLEYEDLYIDLNLLEHTENFKILRGTVGDSNTTITNGSILFNSKLTKGDKVAMRETTDGRYYVSGKVKGGV